MTRIKSKSSVMRYFQEPEKDFDQIRFFLDIELSELKFYLEEINRFIESRIAVVNSLADEDIDIKENLDLAYNYQNQPHNILRESIIIALTTILERFVDVYCETVMIHQKLKISYKDLNGNMLTRFKLYIKKVTELNIDFHNKSWEDIIGVYEIRNAIVHRGGHITEEKKRKIKSFIQRHESFSLSEEGFILLSHDSCTDSLSIIREFFIQIIDVAKLKFK